MDKGIQLILVALSLLGSVMVNAGHLMITSYSGLPEWISIEYMIVSFILFFIGFNIINAVDNRTHGQV